MKSGRAFSISFMVGLLLIGVAAFPSPGKGSLKWKTTEINLAPALGEKEAEAVFAFTNEGEAPVTLTQVTASCGCTVPKLEQRTFQPGESGEIRAVYNIGERQGRNRSTISIHTDALSSPRHTLTLHVDIPVAIQALPRTVNWRVGEEGAPKIVTVIIHPDLDLKLSDVSGTSEQFSIALEPESEPGRYQITITPASTETRQRATFSLNFEEAPPRPVQVFAFIF